MPRTSRVVCVVHQHDREPWDALSVPDADELKAQIRRELGDQGAAVIVVPPGCCLDICKPGLADALASAAGGGEGDELDDLDDEDDPEDDEEEEGDRRPRSPVPSKGA